MVPRLRIQASTGNTQSTKHRHSSGNKSQHVSLSSSNSMNPVLLISFVAITHFLQFAQAANLDVHLQTLLNSIELNNTKSRAPNHQRQQRQMLRYPRSICHSKQANCAGRTGTSQQDDTELDPIVHVLMEIKHIESIELIRSQGGEVRTILPNGLVTATLPVSLLHSLAQRDDIGRIEAAKPLAKMNDVSNSLYSMAVLDENQSLKGNIYFGMNNTRSRTGQGVIFGVIDTGIDW